MPNTTWRRDVGSVSGSGRCREAGGAVEEGEPTTTSSAAAAEEGRAWAWAWAWVRIGGGRGCAGRCRRWKTMKRERRGSPTRSARSGTACDGIAMVGSGDAAVWF